MSAESQIVADAMTAYLATLDPSSPEAARIRRMVERGVLVVPAPLHATPAERDAQEAALMAKACGPPSQRDDLADALEAATVWRIEVSASARTYVTPSPAAEDVELVNRLMDWHRRGLQRLADVAEACHELLVILAHVYDLTGVDYATEVSLRARLDSLVDELVSLDRADPRAASDAATYPRDTAMPSLPANWRAQFAAIFPTSVYRQIVEIIAAWPGVGLESGVVEPLVGEQRDAVHVAANSMQGRFDV